MRRSVSSIRASSCAVILRRVSAETARADRIDAAVQKALAEPDIKARFETFAFEPLGWTPLEIEREAQQKSRLYAELVARKNISLD